MDRVLEAMVEAARAGGEVALARFRRGVEATLKPDGSPVTEADREAEEVIARTLGAAFPEQISMAITHRRTDATPRPPEVTAARIAVGAARESRGGSRQSQRSVGAQRAG